MRASIVFLSPCHAPYVSFDTPACTCKAGQALARFQQVLYHCSSACRVMLIASARYFSQTEDFLVVQGSRCYLLNKVKERTFQFSCESLYIT